MLPEKVKAIGAEEKGFTLIEIIIVAALLGIIFSTASLYYTSSVRMWDKSNDQTEVQQQARVTLGELVPDLQQTQSLKYRSHPSHTWEELSRDFTLNLGDGGELLFSIPQLTQGGSLLSVRYYLRDTSLIRCTGGHNPIAMYITRLEFMATAGLKGTVRIEVEAVKGEVGTKMATTVYLRNLRRGVGKGWGPGRGNGEVH